MMRRSLAFLSLLPLPLCAGCLAVAAAGVVGGAWYLSSDSTVVQLVDRNYDTTWIAAMKVAEYRAPKKIKALTEERRIELEDSIEIVIELEAISPRETRIKVSARSHSGWNPDRDTAQWVAERIHDEATR